MGHTPPLGGTTGSASTYHITNFACKSEGKDGRKPPQTHTFLESSCSPAAISAINHVLTIRTARTRSCQRWEAVDAQMSAKAGALQRAASGHDARAPLDFRDGSTPGMGWEQGGTPPGAGGEGIVI